MLLPRRLQFKRFSAPWLQFVVYIRPLIKYKQDDGACFLITIWYAMFHRMNIFFSDEQDGFSIKL